MRRAYVINKLPLPPKGWVCTSMCGVLACVSAHIYHIHKLQCLASFSTHRVHVEHHVAIHHMAIIDAHAISISVWHYSSLSVLRPSRREICDAQLVKRWNMYAPFIVRRLPLPLVVNDALIVCYSIHNELSITNNDFFSRLMIFPKVALSDNIVND